jgi:hypothetical protein
MVFFRGGDFFFDIAPRFVHGFGKHPHIFVRTLNAVKRRFGLIAHGIAFPTACPMRVALRIN